MSRSWTSALRVRLPRPLAAAGAKTALGTLTRSVTRYRAGSVVGIAIGRYGISCAGATAGNGARRVEWVKQRDLSVPFFTGAPTPGHVEALAGAVAELCGAVARSYIPIYVALPDPVVHFTVFELEQLPATARAQADLARWRYAKEVFPSGREFDCASQYLGQGDGKFLLLGLAVDRAWLACVSRALQQAGVMPWGMNSAACYRFNQFHSTLTGVHQGGALISLDRDAWALSIWDAAGRLRYVRAHWREPGADEACYRDVAVESERTILAYVRGDAQRAVGCLYVGADAPDQAGLIAVLNDRVKAPVIGLPAMHGLQLPADAAAVAAVGVPLAAAIAQ